MTSAHTVVTQQRLSLEYEESVIVCVVKLYSRDEPAMNSDALAIAWNSHILVIIIIVILLYQMDGMILIIPRKLLEQ